MPAAKPGEVWSVDLGMVAKVRPCLILTRPPKPDELGGKANCFSKTRQNPSGNLKQRSRVRRVV